MDRKERPVLRVPKREGQEHLKRLKEENRLDPERKISEEGDDLLIPVTEGGNEERCDLEKRIPSNKPPFHQIKQKLDLPDEEKEKLPDRWEMIGEVLLIKLPKELQYRKERIAEVYAEKLGAKTVMLQGSIEGRVREPIVEKIYGEETETVHVENDVLYKLDTAELMFSSGNIDERIRITEKVKRNEVIVDMFAGIGYFSLPMAVHGDPKKIHALEINPKAFRYLQENIELNDVQDTVEPELTDNRDFSFTGADRVMMGYLDETWKYLDKAVGFLGEEGTIHYHTTCKDSEYPEQVENELKENIEEDFSIRDLREIKSYAPHVFHVVATVRIEK